MPSITKQGTVLRLNIVKHQVLRWPCVKVKLEKNSCVLILENDDVT